MHVLVTMETSSLNCIAVLSGPWPLVARKRVACDKLGGEMHVIQRLGAVSHNLWAIWKEKEVEELRKQGCVLLNDIVLYYAAITTPENNPSTELATCRLPSTLQ